VTDFSHKVRFEAATGLQFEAFLDEQPGSIVSGYGGWQTVSRWRRVAITQFVGAEPVRVALPIVFDGFREGKGQEVAISHLERMARSPGDGKEPPRVNIFGAVPRRDIDNWVIESLDYSQQKKVIWDIIGGVPVRLRQDVVVNLLQAVDDDRIALANIAGTGFGAGGAPGAARPAPRDKFYVVKEDDTIWSISKHEYGDAKWYRDIMKANHLRSPWLRTGMKLRMP
jgi:hypothetical protein